MLLIPNYRDECLQVCRHKLHIGRRGARAIVVEVQIAGLGVVEKLISRIKFLKNVLNKL